MTLNSSTLQRLNTALLAQLIRVARVANAASEGIVTAEVQSEDQPLTYCNDGFCELTGYDRHEVLGHNCRFLQCEETDPQTVDAIRDAIEAGESITEVILNETKHGERFWNELSLTPVTDDDGRVIEYIGFQRDVTDRVEAVRNLEARERELRKYKRIIENATDAVFVTDADGRYELVNARFAEFIGRPKSEIQGCTVSDLGEIQSGEFATPDQLYRQSDSILHREHIVTINDDNVTFSTTQVPRNDTGQPGGVIGISHDISEQKKLQRELEQQALYDELTGLPNRTLFRDRLEHAIRRARRGEYYVSVSFIDIDNFKAINDSLGHAAGDAVLQHIGKRLRDTLRHSDTVARLGGDEFMLLLESSTSHLNFEKIGERLCQAIAPPIELNNYEIPVSASIGFAYPDEAQLASDSTGEIREQLVRAADRAMYRSKQQSDTTWAVLSSASSGQSSRRVQREDRIRQGLENDEFVPHFQPIFSLPSQKLVAMEVLARWEHPERGLVSPGEFIPLAEKSSLICDLGEVVLETACQIADHAWPIDTVQPHNTPLYVNLSPRQLKQASRIDRLIEIVERFSPEVPVGFEVTESQLIESEAPISRMHGEGIDIIVDDFGSGYSSFKRLKEIEVDALKLDMSFVQGALTNEADAAIAETVATLGNRLSLPVIGEGVESTRHLQFLIDAGFRAAQGFHLGRPSPIDELFEQLPEGALSRHDSSLMEDTVPERKP
jgi:diguanylate cyclase (GGDEF)-like protein/PAS domain S-box-containing protein